MITRLYNGYFGLLLFVCAILPTVYFTHLLFLYNEKRLFQVGLLLLGGLLFIVTSQQRIKKWRGGFPTYVWWGIGLVLLLVGLSVTISPFPFYSLVEVSLWALFVLVGFIVAQVISENDKAVWGVFGTACLLAFLYTIKFGLGYYFYLSGFQDFPLWPGGGFEYTLTGFSNIRFFNQVQVFTLPLLIGSSVLGFKKNKYASYFLFLLPVIWWMLLIQSAGRGIILCLPAAALLVLWYFKESTHRWIWYFLGSLAIGFLAKVVLFDLIPDPDQVKSIVRGGSSRLIVWPQTFWASLEQPILGHGPMAFASLDTDFYRGHPHNSVLQLLYEYGYPVTLLVLSGVWMGIKEWAAQSKELFYNSDNIADKRKETVIRVSLTVSLFGGLLYSLFSGIIVMPLSQLWLAITIGSILGLYFRKRTNPNNDKRDNKISILASKFMVLVAAGILVAVMIKDVPHLRENERAYVKETESNVLRPRFWQQGKIGLEYQYEQKKPSAELD